MPVTYVIDKQRKFIHTRCVGVTTFDEVIGHFDKLSMDPDCPDQLDVLLDLSEMTSIPESEQLRAVSKKIKETKSVVQFGCCAVVAIQEILFGMSRVFEVYTASHFSAVRVFKNIDEARYWLAKERKDA